MSTIFGTPNNKCTTWKRKIKLFCRVSPRLHHPLRPPWEGMPGPPTPSLPSAGRGHRWRSSPPDSVILGCWGSPLAVLSPRPHHPLRPPWGGGCWAPLGGGAGVAAGGLPPTPSSSAPSPESPELSYQFLSHLGSSSPPLRFRLRGRPR
jgi:hypothetical protein